MTTRPAEGKNKRKGNASSTISYLDLIALCGFKLDYNITLIDHCRTGELNTGISLFRADHCSAKTGLSVIEKMEMIDNPRVENEHLATETQRTS